jgi:hypothetical protein
MYRNKQKEGIYAMAAIILDLQDALVTFVKERLPPHRWEYLTNRFAIEREIEDDSLSDLKDHFWNELMDAVRWSAVVEDIEELVRRNQELQGEEEEDCSPQSSDEEE